MLYLELLLVVGLVALNGVLSMSELAVVSSRPSRLRAMRDRQVPGARVALALAEHPGRFLSTVQVGITLVGILAGAFSGASLGARLSDWLMSAGMERSWSEPIGFVLVVTAITYVSLVIGELVPKRIGQFNAESTARLVARPIMLLAQVSRPLVSLLSISTNGLLRLLGIRDSGVASVTEEDIHAMLAEGSEAGVIEKQEHDMLRNVFRLDDRQLNSLMIPRGDIVYLDINQPLADNLKRITESERSRFPVCRDGLYDIMGVISAKQLFNQMHTTGTVDLTLQLQECIYVPESLTGMELLGQFRASTSQMVFVIDEYGEIQGLVTLQDVLESVAGDFLHTNADEAWGVQRGDGSWLLDGLIPLPELRDCLGLKTTPEEDKNRYHTLSGMMMWLLGHMPRTGDMAVWEQWRFEVVDLDGKRVDKVLATQLTDVSVTPAIQNALVHKKND